MFLTTNLTIGETLERLPYAQREPRSRFIFRSPCYFIRSIDITVHIVFPEMIESVFPALAHYLRYASPRWGRSWREW
jgi:hypothetical protein